MDSVVGAWRGRPIFDEVGLSHLPEDFKRRHRERIERRGVVARYTFRDDGTVVLEVMSSPPVTARYQVDGKVFVLEYEGEGGHLQRARGEIEDDGRSFTLSFPPALFRFERL